MAADADRTPNEVPGPSGKSLDPTPRDHEPDTTDQPPADPGPGRQAERARHALELVLADGHLKAAGQHGPDPSLARYVSVVLESLLRFGAAVRGVGDLSDEAVERLARRAAYDGHFELAFQVLTGSPLDASGVVDLMGPLGTVDAVQEADVAGTIAGFDEGPLRRYPAKQFSDGQPIPGLPTVLAEFRRHDHQMGDRTVCVWLFSPSEFLDEQTPVQRMRADGRASEDVRRAAFIRAASWAR